MTLAADDPEMKVRTARKRHRCEGAYRWNHTPTPINCSGKIQPGERYVEYLGETPDYASGSRYCEVCSVAAGLLLPREAA